MAESYRLKDGFGPDVAEKIAGWIAPVDPGFDAERFVALARNGLDELELMARSRHVTGALVRTLPDDPERAIAVLTAALPSETEAARWRGMQGFVLMPFSMFVGEHGLACFEPSMTLQYELTKRFTAEFSMRPFLRADPDRTLARLSEWTGDESHHVRRLVSESTRPRLPWAPRLTAFQQDPSPVLPLLDRLKDDPSAYVRRSVANNLNDIAKDHPDVTIRTAESWWQDGDEQRRALVRHALRTMVKQGDPRALAVLGYGSGTAARVVGVTVTPQFARIGGVVRIEVTLGNPGADFALLLVDLAVDFVKSAGGTSRKVFKGADLRLPPGEGAVVRKSISLAQHTTRRHYPGAHQVTVLLNGESSATAGFTLTS